MKKTTKIGTIAILTLLSTSIMAQEKTILRKDLLQAAINQHISLADMKEVTMTAGQAAPKHMHPCPVIGFIKSGNVLFQVEGEEKIILSAGHAFFEPKNKNILHFDNASMEEPLTFVAIYLKEADEDIIKLVK